MDEHTGAQPAHSALENLEVLQVPAHQNVREVYLKGDTHESGEGEFSILSTGRTDKDFSPKFVPPLS